MKNRFMNMGQRLARFMYGRHGSDRFNMFLTIAGYVFLIISIFPYMQLCIIPALLLFGYSWFRFLSRNEYKRRAELQKYMKIRGKVRGFFRLQKDKWKDRKTHRYYHCPGCRAVVRIKRPPRGKTITMHCPACGRSFDKRT